MSRTHSTALEEHACPLCGGFKRDYSCFMCNESIRELGSHRYTMPDAFPHKGPHSHENLCERCHQTLGVLWMRRYLQHSLLR